MFKKDNKCVNTEVPGMASFNKNACLIFAVMERGWVEATQGSSLVSAAGTKSSDTELMQ